MPADLSVVDSILTGLANVKESYQFEYDQLATFITLLRKHRNEKLANPQLDKGKVLFEKETASDLEYYEDRMVELKKKIDGLSKDIDARRQAKAKLIELFDSLQSLDSMERSKDDAGMPIMNIREELDEDGNVINSSVEPYDSSKNSVFNEALEKTKQEREPKQVEAAKVEPKAAKAAKVAKTVKKVTTAKPAKPAKPAAAAKPTPIRPYITKEEVDEDGNIVRSSVKATDEQLAELFEDMDLKPRAKIEEIDDEEAETIKEQKSEDEAPKPAKSSTYTAEIDPKDLLTLEVLSNEVNDEHGDDEDDEDDENDTDDNYDELVPSGAQSLLMDQVRRLRESKMKEAEASEPVQSEIKETVKSSKKCVSFSDSVDVKQVDDIWDDLKKSEFDNEGKVSRFKQMMDSDPDQKHAVMSGMVIGDVMEHFTPVDPKPEDLVKLGKKPSKFKAQRASKPHSASPTPIVPPKEINPSKPETLSESFVPEADEDPDTLFEEYEVIEKDQAPLDLDNVKVASIDYQGLKDMETMAKAYTMDLYGEPDFHGDPVIEKMEDFEKHNEGVKQFEQLAEGVEEEKIEEVDDIDDRPLMEDDIIEHSGTELPDGDVEISIDNLNTEVALDYARMREHMIQKYGGGYSEKKTEKEFEPINPPEKVSRFKAARLGQ